MRRLGHCLTSALFLVLAPACAITPQGASGPVAPFAAAAKATINGRATGAVLVAMGGRILWESSVGTDMGCGRPPAPADTFDALSLGKTFTAIAVQKLAAQGRLDLNAPLRRYIPELPASRAEVTVQNTLDNASGWGAYLNDEGDFDPESEAELVHDLGAAEVARPVGKYGYSNTGFQALGLVVQRASGKPFKDAMQELVFRPARLSNTDFLGSARWRERPVAIGCKDGKPTGSVRTWPSTWNLLGAAGIGTTVHDLYRLNRYFVFGTGLGSAGRARMLADGAITGGAAPYREAGRTRMNYGSGLYHWRDSQGRRVHFHGGDGNFGFHDAMFWRQDDDLLIVGMFNSGNPAGSFDRSAFINAFAAAAEATKNVARAK